MTELARALREQVCQANLLLAERGLVTGTFGNVSGVDRAAGLFVIKASGVPYHAMTWEHMVPVSLDTGAALEGALRPSSDTPTHHELYRAFGCGGIAHTHSDFATAFAQAATPIPCTGTTHADFFRGDVPVTRAMTRDEVERDYERHTGLVIVETFRTRGISPEEVPGVVVANHGPFAWGADAGAAAECAHALETVARIECIRRLIKSDAPLPAAFLIDKHFLRKHGAGAYYGQKPDIG
jgi:L-ribulose-5-phosphate 4-epimerase